MKSLTLTRYKILLVGILAYSFFYFEISRSNSIDEIQKTVSETNVIVKDIRTRYLTTPYSLENEYHCLASNIYWESRNQSLNGKVAVGQVVLNRVDSTAYGDSICGVVKQTKYYPSGGINLHDCQFSWYCDGKSDIPWEREKHIYEESFMLAVRLLENRPMDFTEGATHYHNNKVNPYWADSLERVTRIDDHIFYRNK